MPQSKKFSGCCTAVPSKQILHGFGEAKGGYEGLNISICISRNPLVRPHGQFSLAWSHFTLQNFPPQNLLK